MDTETIQLLIPGLAISSAPEADLRGLLKITPIGSHRILPATRGEFQPEVMLEAPAGAIINLEYESGLCEWLRVDQFCDELSQDRGEGPVRVPRELDRGDGQLRGLTGWVLKGLHVFHVSPVDAMANETAEAVIRHFDERLKTGLYKLLPDGTFGGRIGAQITDSTRPYLIFIHGTASSTQGSFSGFWRNEETKRPTTEWLDIVSKYEDRILALEHKTFSVSPAQNALDLVGLLPNNAILHVITHSRGGLVGELLGLGELTPDDLSAFQGRPDEKLLQSLSTELKAKNPGVAKFVRTACPAAGTILASKRLDLYLNVILNVIGLIPGLKENPAYEIFKATALELIKLRADPTKIPGLEAQMPESPFIHLLNTRGRYSDADLAVIAGDFEGSGVWGTLKSYALRAYFWEDNDFVVNTKSMSRGLERKKGVRQFLDRGPGINHFSYFKNGRTRVQMLNWLAAPPGKDVEAFTRVRGITESDRGMARGSADWPVVFLVPDVFGTNLKEPGPGESKGDVWLNYDALAKGRFQDLSAGANLVPGDVHEFYKKLYQRLASSYDAVAFSYDWRQAIEASARQLDAEVDKKLRGTERTVRFIAHGMGGLVVRDYARQNPERWKELTKDGGGFLMLGTPNFGSWHVVRLLAGRSRLVRMLALLGRHSEAEVLSVLRSCRGLIDMLPEEMYDPSRWLAEKLPRPDAELLIAGGAWRRALKEAGIPPGRMSYVSGSAPATPLGVDLYTVDGDGQVTYSLGLLPGAKTWYNPDAAHGDLVSQPDALIDILAKGRTSALDSVPHPLAAIPDLQRLRQQEEAVFFPTESDIVRAALGASGEPSLAPEQVLRIRVTHGHLREAKYLLAVGHYAGDSIVSGEAELDRQLAGRLSTRFHVDIYPGPAGSAEVIRAPGAHPPGAIIVGLGDVGEITPERVRRGVLEACLRYAMMHAEDPDDALNQPHSAAFSSLLIGVSGGRAISVADSITSTVRAALAANRVLRDRNLAGKVRIDEIEFVELYEDVAIEAAHAAASLSEFLRNDLAAGERVEFDNRLRSAPGGLLLRPLNEYTAGWWRRIQIAADRCDQNKTYAGASSTALVFTSLTDRARAEETLAASQTRLVNALLADATRQPAYDEDSAVALFELLLPNALKDRAPNEADLVLVLDSAAAAYPWEALARRAGDKVLPLAIQSGMIRQLKVSAIGPGPRGAREPSALVVGDSKSDLAELPGAQAEARDVAKLLEENGYSAHTLIRQDPLNIVRRLFAKEYRILHLAGHGIYNPDDPAKSGMVLAPGVFLTPLELCQIRELPDFVFINCCHLGRIDGRDDLLVSYPHRMAASVAQALIGRGVKAVIAAGWAVNDAAALVFAKKFYRDMLSGRPYGEAVKEARREARYTGSNNTWGAYQCYGNPDFRLTPIGERGPAARTFYSRREWIDELKDIAASARGQSGDAISKLRNRIDRMEAVPSAWRDGEVLSTLADAQKAVRNANAAIDAYQDALQIEKTTAPVSAIEQLANVRDKLAVELFRTDEQAANEMWDKAEADLESLNRLLGDSSERLSLLGALWKRRARADVSHKHAFLDKAAKYYKDAYQHTLRARGEIDPYPGLNAIAVNFVAGGTDLILPECIEDAKRPRDDPDFWHRIYRADAMLLEHLVKKDLKDHVPAVMDAYKQILLHGAPNERNTVLEQLRFIAEVSPKPEGLDGIIEALPF